MATRALRAAYDLFTPVDAVMVQEAYHSVGGQKECLSQQVHAAPGPAETAESELPVLRVPVGYARCVEPLPRSPTSEQYGHRWSDCPAEAQVVETQVQNNLY